MFMMAMAGLGGWLAPSSGPGLTCLENRLTNYYSMLQPLSQLEIESNHNSGIIAGLMEKPPET
jgi:hypothetical protein